MRVNVRPSAGCGSDMRQQRRGLTAEPANRSTGQRKRLA